MTLHLENGKDVVITAPQQSDVNRYVGSLRVNGAEYGKNFVNHTDLIAGMKMDYTMQSEPNLQRGTSDEAAPYSFSKEYKAAPQKGKKKSKK
jgi:putative alpha-1,2-mannosidase